MSKKQQSKGKPSTVKPRRVRKAPSLVGSDRPKVSVFLDRPVRDKARRIAEKTATPLTVLLETFILTGLAGLSKRRKK